MTRDEQVKLLDTLTKEQRDGIAALIRETIPEYDWMGGPGDGYAVFAESVSSTLDELARLFSTHEPRFPVEL